MAEVSKPSTASAQAPKSPTRSCIGPTFRALIAASVSMMAPALSITSSCFCGRGFGFDRGLIFDSTVAVGAAHGHDCGCANKHRHRSCREHRRRAPLKIFEKITECDRPQDRAQPADAEATAEARR